MKLLREQLMKISKALVFDIKRFAVHDKSFDHHLHIAHKDDNEYNSFQNKWG